MKTFFFNIDVHKQNYHVNQAYLFIKSFEYFFLPPDINKIMFLKKHLRNWVSAKNSMILHELLKHKSCANSQNAIVKICTEFML